MSIHPSGVSAAWPIAAPVTPLLPRRLPGITATSISFRNSPTERAEDDRPAAAGRATRPGRRGRRSLPGNLGDVLQPDHPNPRLH
jgi:hypothetical protein